MRLFFLLLAFILGLLLFVFLPVIIALSVLYLIYLYWRKGGKFALLGATFFLLGALTSQISFSYDSSDNTYSGFVREAKENYIIFSSHGERYYVYEKENSYEVGDYLTITGYPKELSFYTYESQFDFKSYLNNKGVYRQLNVTSVEVGWRNPLRFKEAKQSFLSNFDEDTAALIDSFLFFNKDYENATISLANKMNIVYLFSVSGVYLYLMMGAVTYLLSLKLSKTKSEILTLVIFSPFFLISFWKPSILRIALLYVFRIINFKLLKNRFNALERLSILTFIFLIIDYHLIYQSSFYVGFAIAFILNFARGSLSRQRKLFQKLFVPLLIYFLLIPFSLTMDSAVHLFSPLFQLIFLPLNLPFVILSLMSFYTVPFTSLLNGYGSFLGKVVAFFYNYDIKIYLGELSVYFILVYYVLIIVALYLFEARMIPHFKVSTLILISFLLINAMPIRPLFVKAIDFINVGQGDAILIRNKNDAILIDTGGSLYTDIANETLIPYFRKKQVSEIDLLITTHDDYDHNGAASSLIENFTVKEYVTSSAYFPITVGDITFYNLNVYEADDDNDKSLVIYFSFIGYDFLLMGDASSTVEAKIIEDHPDLNCDILKVGHHGSNTSSSYEFLETVSPLEAVISVGNNNYYGHPHDEVISNLESLGIKIRRTDLEGTITYSSF